MIPIAKPLIGEEEKKAVLKVLDSGIITQGPVTKEFEEEFAKFIGSKFAIATDSGTAALHLALIAYNIGKGDEVITTPFTFVSSVNSIVYTGAKPVFVDIDEDSFNINPELIEEKITDKTKAIMPVHLYGNPANLDAISKIAKKYNLIVIEDACQAHNASINGKKVGSFNTSCFSFHPTKNMATAKGGMITTNDREIFDIANKLRLCGEEKRYFYNVLGYNYRMSDIHAAIGLEQLKKLDRFTEQRIRNAKFFNDNIQVKGIVLPKIKDGYKHVFHQYTIRVTEKCKLTRDELIELLNKNEISCAIHYPLPIHKQKLYEKDYKNQRYSISEKISKEVLSLPVHPALTQEDLNKIVNTLNKIK